MEIRPYTKRTSRCPFYGFIVKSNIMIDTEENHCALASVISLLSSPYCLMEAIRDKPGWDGCSLNTERNGKKLVEILEKIRVCPREYRPAKGTWDGWPLKIWLKYLENTTSIED
jgi:hypothetical protein